MANETGIEKEMLANMLKRLEEKIVYVDGFVFIKNFVKHQTLSESVKKGIERIAMELPQSLLKKVIEINPKLAPSLQGVYTPTTTPDILKPNGTNLDLNLDSNANSEGDVVNNKNVSTNVQQVVNHFFVLKGWDNKGKEYYKTNKIIYARFLRPAKDLLDLCENNIDEANLCLSKVADWAKSRELDWSIETVFKKWYDIDKLKPKEKKPYLGGFRAFQKNNQWYVIKDSGEINMWAGKKEVVWK